MIIIVYHDIKILLWLCTKHPVLNRWDVRNMCGIKYIYLNTAMRCEVFFFFSL